jgi:Flp pilus assembly protein TadD
MNQHRRLRREAGISGRGVAGFLAVLLLEFPLIGRTRPPAQFAPTGHPAECAGSIEQGKSLLEQRRPREAQALLREASSACAGDAQFFDLLGLACETVRDFEQAQAAYRKAIALQPTKTVFRNHLASSYVQSGNQTAAIAEYQRTLKIDPRDSNANLNLGTLYLTEKHYQQAIHFLKAAGEGQSEDPILLLELTQAYVGAKDTASARATAAKASGLAGSDPRMHFSLGLLLAQLGDYQRAVEEFQAVPASDRDAAADLDLGMALSKLGRYDEARQVYLDAIRQEPSSPDPYLRIGLDAVVSGDSVSAVDWLTQAHERAPRRADISYALAEGLIGARNFERARSLLDDGLRARPEDSSLLDALGDLSLNQENYAEAVKAYARSLKSDPRGLSARLSLAKCYIALKENAQAQAELERVLAMDPRNAEAQAQRGHLALQSNQLDVALKWFREALANDQYNPTANEDYAALMLKEGKANEARTALERLIKRHPNNSRFHYLLGQALVKLGDAEGARKEFELSQKLKAATPVPGNER